MAGTLGRTRRTSPSASTTLSETVNFAAEMVAGAITDLYLPRRK